MNKTNNTKATWLIYGANGFTGKLIAEQAKREGLTPVLGGRNTAAIEGLAKALGFKAHVFACTSADAVAKELEGYAAVLHCAGPFAYTSPVMTQACAKAKCHYMDITGEMTVLESLLSQSEFFKEAGIAVMPGVGFDVVPTDCVAAMLKQSLPLADTLTLAFQATGRMSRGTLSTMIDNLESGSCRRVFGKFQKTALGERTKHIQFLDKEKLCVGIPWGDVASAFYSTAIPNIEVYNASKPAAVQIMRLANHLRPVLGMKPVKNLFQKMVGPSGDGPSAEVRAATFCRVWGEVSEPNGGTKVMRLQTPNGYDLTVNSALAVMKATLAGKVKPGAWTPSQAMGPEFVLTLPGVKRLESRHS